MVTSRPSCSCSPVSVTAALGFQTPVGSWFGECFIMSETAAPGSQPAGSWFAERFHRERVFPFTPWRRWNLSQGLSKEVGGKQKSFMRGQGGAPQHR